MQSECFPLNRFKAARRLTSILENKSGASFLRLGDGELRFLLEMQESRWEDGRYDYLKTPSCEEARGTLGLNAKDYPRLLAAYEGTDVLDLYVGQDFNRGNIGKLNWSRRNDGWTISEQDFSGLINDWTFYEFPSYVTRHRVLIAGAEAPLLKELMTEPKFRDVAKTLIPSGCEFGYYTPPEGGRKLSDHIDRIKEELFSLIKNEGYDTLLLALGGAAKILCFELATETGVRAIDFGSMLRGITYSGADGHAVWRASHNPFFFRVPFDVYMRCVERAWPELSTSELLGKAHAQLCLELQRKSIGKTFPADVHDPGAIELSPENIANFNLSFTEYKADIRRRASSEEERKLVKEMVRWKRKKGLGWGGRIFQILVACKAGSREIFGYFQQLFRK